MRGVASRLQINVQLEFRLCRGLRKEREWGKKKEATGEKMVEE